MQKWSDGPSLSRSLLLALPLVLALVLLPRVVDLYQTELLIYGFTFAIAALGFVAYATYDLTNQATLKIWDARLTLIDMSWGTFATALAAGAGYWLTQRFSA